MEYLQRGALLNVLRDERENLTILDLLEMCMGPCAGLIYLQNLNIIHRDIALRNLLVTNIENRWVVKISDFGLSRNSSAYEVHSDTKFPVRWTAPEVLMGGDFTSKNDVWSFGVTLFEIFAFGAVPYIWLTNKEAFTSIPKGEKLSIPTNCPQKVYDVIMTCCTHDPVFRPDFNEVKDLLEDTMNSLDKDEANIKPFSIRTK